MSEQKEVYILAIYPIENKQNNDIKFKEKENLIQIMYRNEINKNNVVVLKYSMKKPEKVDKVKKEAKKEDKKEDKKEYIKTIQFFIQRDKYTIEFELKKKTYIYQPKLTKLNQLIGIKKEISQNEISNSTKMNIFYSVIVEESGKNEKLLNILYNESISLYGNEPNFSLLINIFVKIYKDFYLCKLLFNEFKKFLKKAQKELSQNYDIINEIEYFHYLNIIKEICDYAEGNNIIREYKDTSVDYYGVILCYYCNYDSQEISQLIKYIYNQDSNILFQILFTYNFYLKTNINDKKIIEEYIKFTFSKTYQELVKSGLIYLKNHELFLGIINKYKEKIISIKNFQPLPIKNLESPKSIKEIRFLLEEIIEFSKKNNILLIDFNNAFWANLINICNSTSFDKIKNLYELRELFKKYYEFVSNKKGPIFKNAEVFNYKNEFDIKLHNNIKEYIKNKNIPNIEIIKFIMETDPIYKDEENKNYRDIEIIDQINFDNIDKEFIKAYKDFNFENIFENKIDAYLKKLFEKIKNWNNFCTIYHLINFENIIKIDKTKIKDLINSIIKEYDNLIVKYQINPELKILIETLSEIAIFFNDNEIYNINFFNKIAQCNEEIQDKIYTELYSKYNDEKHKEDVINKIVKKFYIKNLECENFDIFISFIEKLEYNEYKDMMNRINNAYQKSESNDFILLCKLNYKFIKKEENIFLEKNKTNFKRINILNQQLKKEKNKNEKKKKNKMDIENLNKDLKKKFK